MDIGKLWNMERFPQLTPEKKTSGIDRILGVGPEDETDIKNYFSELCQGENLEAFVREPGLEFREILPKINFYLKEFLEEYGVNTLDILLSQVVFLDKEKLSDKQRIHIENSRINAFYHPRSQKIVLFEKWDENRKLALLHALVHEMIHVQAFESWQKIPKGKENEKDFILSKGDRSMHIDLRRLGFRMVDKDRNVTYFHDLDEAITTELTMRFDWKYFEKFPELSAEISERKEAILAFANRNKSSFEKEKRHVAEIEHEKLEDGMKKANIKGYSYDQEREKFMILLGEIYRSNQQQFASIEDVFSEFAKAALTGRTLPLARIIENMYGKGSFRYLGEITSISSSLDIE